MTFKAVINGRVLASGGFRLCPKQAPNQLSRVREGLVDRPITIDWQFYSQGGVRGPTDVCCRDLFIDVWRVWWPALQLNREVKGVPDRATWRTSEQFEMTTNACYWEGLGPQADNI